MIQPSIAPVLHTMFRPLMADRGWVWYSMAIIMFIGAIIATEQYVLGAVIGAVVGVLPLVVMVLVRYPRVWLNCVALSTFYWFNDKSDDVTALEVLLVGFYLGTLLLWFAMQFLITRKKLLRNSADKAIALFCSLLPFNLCIALFNDISLVEWLRASLLIMFVLYYFPLREYLESDRHIIIFVLCLCISFLIMGAITVQNYVKAASNAVYAFQIVSSRIRNNEIVAVCASVCSAMAFVVLRKPLHRIVALSLTAFFIGVLIGSFSRGFWLGFLVGMLLLVFHFRPEEKRFLVISFGISFIVMTVVLFTMFGRAGELALRVLGTRFTSSTIGKRDLSVQSRLNESTVVVQQILEHPLTGTGAGSRYNFFEPFVRHTYNVTFIHNGYLFMLHKYGFPMTILWYYAMFWYLWKGWRRLPQLRAPLYRFVGFGGFATFCAAMIVNNTSSQFESRDGTFIASFMIAFISIALYREQNIDLHDGQFHHETTSLQSLPQADPATP